MDLLQILTGYIVAPGTNAAILIGAVIGLSVSGFLRTVIDRMPKMMQRDCDNFIASETGKEAVHTDRFNLLWPFFKCAGCGVSSNSVLNFPFLAPFRICGKRKCCGGEGCSRASFLKRAAIEASSIVLAGATLWCFGLSVVGIAALLLVFALITLSAIDAETKLLPDDITLPLLWLGILVNSIGSFTTLHESVFGAIAGYMILWSLFWVFKLTTGKEGMGYGDFKLLAALGAWFGVFMLPLILMLSAGVGVAVGLSIILISKKGRDYQMPFGPYLAGAGLITLFCGPELTRLLFPTLG